jgi:hypothetical protein
VHGAEAFREGSASSFGLPLACFVALLVTTVVTSILPFDYHLAYAVVEWAEMLVGTISAVVAFVVVFLRRRVPSPVVQGWSGNKWLALSGTGIWCIFWLTALLTHRWLSRAGCDLVSGRFF